MPSHKVFADADSDVEQHEEDTTLHTKKADALLEADVASESDEDAEPEAVTFASGKKNVLDRVRVAIRQIERDRQQLKAKRRKRDQIYVEQKKKKLDRLEKLPSDVLEAVSMKEPAKQMFEKFSIPELDSDDISSEKVPSPVPAADVSTNDCLSADDEDFIPLNNNAGIRAVNVMQKPKLATVAQNAIQFRHQQLYGSQIRREPASAFMAKRAKRKAMRSS